MSLTLVPEDYEPACAACHHEIALCECNMSEPSDPMKDHYDHAYEIGARDMLRKCIQTIDALTEDHDGLYRMGLTDALYAIKDLKS